MEAIAAASVSPQASEQAPTDAPAAAAAPAAAQAAAAAAPAVAIAAPAAAAAAAAAAAPTSAPAAAWHAAQQLPAGAASLEELKAQLRAVVQQLDLAPGICRRGQPMEVMRGVVDWSAVRRTRGSGSKPYQLHAARDHHYQQHGQAAQASEHSLHARSNRLKHSKATGSGRVYTSRFRGVHQTFPTRRWEAQFRRNGKPTSLGCFDKEEEAARAYDKMMLWCEIHAAGGIKGVTNFDLTEYERDVGWLTGITQDELIESLRTEGRRQAMARGAGPGTKRGRSGDATTDGDSDGGAAAAAAAPALQRWVVCLALGLLLPLFRLQQQQQQQQHQGVQVGSKVMQ
ncbi:hypothetical protein OEZ86_008757 [Tetradesmus obliquus]|nr:hypothetical protein OEZ86_008757 [Tetradesmus obliquus]